MSPLSFRPWSLLRRTPHTLLVMLAAIGFGTVPYFARSLTEAGMAAPAIAFYRYLIAAVFLLPFLRLKGVGQSATLWGLGGGALMSIGWIGYVHALQAAPVSLVVVIYMTYPVFTLLIGWFGFRDRPDRNAVLGAGLIVLAAVLVASPTGQAPIAMWAVFLALLAPIGFGVGINILTRKLPVLPPLSRMACFSLGAVLGLLPLIVTTDSSAVLPVSLSGAALILGIALVTALVPQLVYTVHAPKIGAARTAMAGSVELPTMFAVGWLAFGEVPTLLHLLAGGLVLGAIFITTVRHR